MKRYQSISVLFLIVLMSSSALAVSSTLQDTYAQRETIIGQLSENVINAISKDQVSMVRNQNVQVGFDFDVATIGGREFIWIVAPQNPGNYTLIIKDVVSIEGGSPQIADFRHDFKISSSQAPYSINPGFVISSENFVISATSYLDSSQGISVNFPESRTISLAPGITQVPFDISGVIGADIIEIQFGTYVVPAYIIGEDHLCGDGVIDGEEVCDGENLGNETCNSLFGDDYVGSLSCASNCLSFNTNSCEEQEFCDANHLGLCIVEDDCIFFNGYWYEDRCNYYEQGAECDENHLRLCETPNDCLAFDGYWYEDQCNPNEEISCENGYVSQCLTANECERAFGVWANGECTSGVSTTGKGVEVTPAIIRSKVLVDQELSEYVFSVRNVEKDVKDVSLSFNPTILAITPSEVKELGFNESAEFRISVVNRSKDVREVVVVESGEYRTFVLFDLSFTYQSADTGTQFLQGRDEKEYYCFQIPNSYGNSCNVDEVCEGQISSSIDVAECCIGECVPISGSGGSNSWLGYLIAAVIILLLLVVYTWYKKTGSRSRSNPVASRIKTLEKNHP